MKLSVIIPALNEAAYIDKTLQGVRVQPGVYEVIVVDGGSRDETRHKAADNATVLAAPAGRARQMNYGAAYATGDVLLFLHADTLLPPDGVHAIEAALADPSVEAGAFRLRFDHETPLLRLYSFCTRFPLPRLCFGDRGLFVRSGVFEAVGGFPDWPMFEDLEMVRRLYERGGFLFLSQYATTAARRFEQHGPLRQQLHNAYLWLHYLRGADPHTLVHLYRYDR